MIRNYVTTGPFSGSKRTFNFVTGVRSLIELLRNLLQLVTLARVAIIWKKNYNFCFVILLILIVKTIHAIICLDSFCENSKVKK